MNELNNNTEAKKPREKGVFEFFGRVITKNKIKQNSGRYVGQIRYDMIVEIYDNPKVDNIQVMKDNVPDNIWEAVLNSDYYGCNFVFYCYKQGQRYRLFNWRVDSKITEDEK